MPGSFRIGKIAGIDIDIHVSWIIILVLLTVSLATGWFPQLYPGWSSATYWGVGLISALLLFVSVLLHELAHSLVARRRGLPVKNITLFIFALCFLLLLPLRGAHSPLEGILFYLAVTNVLLGVFNLIPGFPLDGGRVLRYIVWNIAGSVTKATRVASIPGQVIADLGILGSIWHLSSGEALN